jgi:phenylpyruvate tautomerase PptA (4-oxalocrotonate tautomerase family)
MQFDEQFFQQIGLGSASDEERAEIIKKLADLVQGRVAMRLSEVLGEHQLEQFDNLLETQGDEAASAYIESVYPTYGNLVQEEIDKAKQELAGDVTAVAARLEQEVPPQE